MHGAHRPSSSQSFFPHSTRSVPTLQALKLTCWHSRHCIAHSPVGTHDTFFASPALIYRAINPAVEHVHCCMLLLAIGDVSASAFAAVGHSRQASEPDEGLYLPASQAAHEPPRPKNPLLQTQSSSLTLATLDWPLTHRLHPVLPALAEKVFLGQSRHATLPLTSLYLPAAHATHSSPTPSALPSAPA